MPDLDFVPDDFRVKPGERIKLADVPSRYAGGMEKKLGEKALRHLQKRMIDLQELLYAEGKRSLLIVFQAMDAGGKDSTIRSVLSPLNQAGCHVSSFKAPSKNELAHDYLWRVHAACPARGEIGVFNRSHYEEVLIVRVKGWVPEPAWKRRYEHINCFEKMLTDEGTTVVKFFLHISKDYQKDRLQRRLDDAAKHWKFNPEDLLERGHWDDYMAAFADCFTKCSTKQAPWYIVPAERRWYRNLVVARTICDTLERMNPKPPKVTWDPSAVVIR